MTNLDVLVDQYINYLLIEKGLSEKTIESYSRDLTRYLDFLKKSGIRDISDVQTTLTLEHLTNLRDDHLGARSRARHLTSLRGFHRFLVQEKILAYDPVRLIELPKSGLKLPDVLSVADIEHILSIPDLKKPRGERDAAMLELLYAAGLRVSELIGLKLVDINTQAGFVRVFGGGGHAKFLLTLLKLV